MLYEIMPPRLHYKIERENVTATHLCFFTHLCTGVFIIYRMLFCYKTQSCILNFIAVCMFH